MAIVKGSEAQRQLFEILTDFVCQGTPQDLAGGRGAATSGVMVKSNLGFSERGFTMGKRTSEQNGCGVAPTVVTKVTYCIPWKVASQLAHSIQHAGIGSKVDFASRRIYRLPPLPPTSPRVENLRIACWMGCR